MNRLEIGDKWYEWLTPETAKHILSWGFIWSAVGMAIFAAAILIFSMFAVRCYKQGTIAETSYSQGNWYIGCGMLWICVLFCTVGFIASAYWMMMVEFYPRLYLLSYLKGFVR